MDERIRQKKQLVCACINFFWKFVNTFFNYMCELICGSQDLWLYDEWRID